MTLPRAAASSATVTTGTVAVTVSTTSPAATRVPGGASTSAMRTSPGRNATSPSSSAPVGGLPERALPGAHRLAGAPVEPLVGQLLAHGVAQRGEVVVELPHVRPVVGRQLRDRQPPPRRAVAEEQARREAVELEEHRATPDDLAERPAPP